MMKWVFWLLLLACAAFFSFMRWGETLLEGGASPHHATPYNESKIRLLKLSAAPQALHVSHPPATSAPAPATCMEWGEFSGADLARAAAALDGSGLGRLVTQHQIERGSGYWVYIPPRSNRVETDKKIAQLKSLGIEEYHVVQEAGKWQHAISLGLFRTGESAQKFLDRIREKGVKSATMGERAVKLTFTLFALKNPETEAAAKMVELQSEFPGSELKAVACD